MRYRRFFLMTLAFLGLLLYNLGCDSADNPIAPSASVLTVVANPTFIELDGTSTIKITGFKPDGNPLNPGTQINLSTSLGILGSTLLEANNQGQAETTLRADPAGQTGMASVTARLPGTEVEAMATVEIANRMPSLTLFANPATVGVGGTARITIIARDPNDFPLADANVRLVPEFGELNTQSVVTDANGEATARFTAGARPGSGRVTALLNNSSLGDSQSSVVIDINDAPSSFSFTTDVGSVSAASEAIIQITVEVQNSLGSPLSGAAVTFSVTTLDGTSIGATFDNGSFIQSTDQSGRVVDNLRIPQGQIEPADQFIVIRATVRGEGVELPPVERRIRIDP